MHTSLLKNHTKASAKLHVEVVRIANVDSGGVVVRDAVHDAVYPLTDLACGPFHWIPHEDMIAGWDKKSNEVTIKIVAGGTIELNGKRTDLEIYIPL